MTDPTTPAALEAQARQIADLTETVAEVRAELDQMIGIAADWRSRAEKAEAENARLRKVIFHATSYAESIWDDGMAALKGDDQPTCECGESRVCTSPYACAAMKGGDNG